MEADKHPRWKDGADFQDMWIMYDNVCHNEKFWPVLIPFKIKNLNMLETIFSLFLKHVILNAWTKWFT